MTDGTEDFSTLSPQEAAAKLSEMAAAYRGAEPSATPTTPQEAAARMSALSGDKSWRERYFAGDAEARREFQALTEKMSAGGEHVELPTEIVDAVSDPSALPAAGRKALLDGLRDQGLPEAGVEYLAALEADEAEPPSQGDGEAARRALERLGKDAEFRRQLLDGDVSARSFFGALNRIAALAGNDGKPVSDRVRAALAVYGL